MRFDKKSICMSLLLLFFSVICVGCADGSANNQNVKEQAEPKQEVTGQEETQEKSFLDDIGEAIASDWSGTKWLDNIELESVEVINFVEEYAEAADAEKAWGYKGVDCFYSDGQVYVICNGLKIEGAMNETFAELTNLTAINGLELIDTSEVTDMSYLFKNCSSLKEIDISKLSTKELINAEGMFFGCESIASLDLSQVDMKKVENMNSMFEECAGLDNLTFPQTENVKTIRRLLANVGVRSCGGYGTTLHGTLNIPNCEDISYIMPNSFIVDYSFVESLDVSNVILAEGALSSCGLFSVDLSGWNTSKIENMNGMFSGTHLREVNVSGWDVSSLKECADMFNYCSGLREIVIDWKNANNVTNVNAMFKRCFTAETIDITAFNGNHFIDASEMFQDCESLKTIYAENITADVSDNMFLYCMGLFPNETFENGEYDFEFGMENACFSRKN